MTYENIQFIENNVEQQKEFDLVANTNTCRLIQVRIVPLQTK